VKIGCPLSHCRRKFERNGIEARSFLLKINGSGEESCQHWHSAKARAGRLAGRALTTAAAINPEGHHSGPGKKNDSTGIVERRFSRNPHEMKVFRKFHSHGESASAFSAKEQKHSPIPSPWWQDVGIFSR
jgi:hypothetical protein